MTKIMLVEDDNNLREIYQARLAAEGYEIVSSSDGEAALALAAKERPDMIISDVMMPKISGFEMLDILRNTDALRNVKIIMLTALGQAEDSQRANALGADRYLVKSQVTLEDIVKSAHELLDDQAPAAVEPDYTATSSTDSSASDDGADDSISTDDQSAIPAPDPVVEDTTEPVVAEPMPVVTPVEPVSAPAAESAAPVAQEPVAEPAEDTVPLDTMTQPPAMNEPVMPAAEQITEPVAPPVDIAPTPRPMTSIPVMDAPAEPVAEPPADVAPEPEQAQPTEAPLEQSDNQPADVAIEPATVEEVQPEAAVSGAAPQSAAAEEASMKAQIDSFIESQTDQTSPSSEPVMDAPGEQPAPAPATDSFAEYEQTPVSMPRTEPEPAPALSAAPSTVESVRSDDGFEEPAAEEIAAYQPPVISGAEVQQPHAAPTPEPQAVPEPEATPRAAEPSAETAPAPNGPDLSEAISERNDALLAGAADNLAVSAGQVITPTEPQPQASVEPAASAPAAPPPTPAPAGPSLDVLDAKAAAVQAAQSTPAQPNVNAYTAPPQVVEEPKNANDDIDPNSISL